MITPGTYRHYKGGIYTVLGVAQHSETKEQLVMYQGEDKQFWVRPLQMFSEDVTVDGNQQPRFTLINA